MRKYIIILLLFVCSISFGQMFSAQNAECAGCDTTATEVTIGTQTWMRKNLAVTKYNDNTNIPKVTDNAAWAALTTPAYCWFDNDSSTYAATYGALYNWYAVNTGKLCPTGWHVPSNAEFETLITFLGGSSVAGGKLKEVGTAHWDSPNTGAIDTLCFTALGAGFRYNNGTYAYIKDFGTFHSTDIDYGVISYYYYLRKSSESFYPDLKENFGFSVRCIKD